MAEKGTKSFQSEFFEHYLSIGLGALSKKDVDALVMHLLDKYGRADGTPLHHYSNQEVSALLKTPESKVKSLRYEAALKFGGRVDDQAMARLLVAVNSAVLDVEAKRVCLIIEDVLAKNWLQGQLKRHGLIFDHSFNSEIIKVDSDGLFAVLAELFDAVSVKQFRDAFDAAQREANAAKRKDLFKAMAAKFATGAAGKAGSAVAAYFGLWVA